ncbi:hypothetical protein CYLTODRAFT_423483 [Cylindrobasidium torrendii FP15055 ss-10]|uniref:Uncharacterized protein n=1 Tax=Cylindrobasidium torrendii FP15055 ss-10 TaxID=1314674 RepID=A0A0D7B7E2_9AGAR|nr:hypothetical protein CYLTODRAFT_423483 [Cylindrobasidium torrendii FP15055 ss-10]
MGYPPPGQTINPRDTIEGTVIKTEVSDDFNDSFSEAEVERVLLEGTSQKKRPILAERSKSLRHAATPKGHPYPTRNLSRTSTSSSATSRSADRSLARFRPRAKTSTDSNARKPRTSDRIFPPPSSLSSGSGTRTSETQPKALFAPRFIVTQSPVVSTENDSDSESTASENDGGKDEMGDTYNEHFDDDFAYLGSFRLAMS